MVSKAAINMHLPLINKKRDKSAQVSCISLQITCFILLLLLLLCCFCDAQRRTSQSEPVDRSISASEPQDSNSDSGDPAPSYDQANGSDAETEDPDSSGLLPPNELSVIRLNDTSVVLRWEFSETMQDRLQFFKVQYKSTKKGVSEWKTDNREIVPSTRAYQINGLRPGNYFFCVNAVYDNDDSIASQAFKYRLKAQSKISSSEMPELTAPKITWTEANHDYFRFKWKYTPKEKDMPYYGFLVYYRSAHTMTDFTIYNTLGESVEIGEVEPETPYEAKVVAYNMQGVSGFSETITIKTKSKPNSTDSTSSSQQDVTTLAPTTVTTLAPATIAITTGKPSEFSTPPSKLHDVRATTTTQKPIVITATPPTAKTPQTSDSPYQQFLSAIDLLVNGKSDSMVLVRYLLLILVPIVFILLVLVCLLSRHRGQKDSQASSSTDGSMQFDMEINGYFKNSFPGVEKDTPYTSVVSNSRAHNHSVAHQGFINNHPSINDFA